jgi:hypothetical protein
MCTKSAKSSADSSTRQEGPATRAAWSLPLLLLLLLSLLLLSSGSNSRELSVLKLAVAKDWLL